MFSDNFDEEIAYKGWSKINVRRISIGEDVFDLLCNIIVKKDSIVLHHARGSANVIDFVDKVIAFDEALIQYYLPTDAELIEHSDPEDITTVLRLLISTSGQSVAVEFYHRKDLRTILDAARFPANALRMQELNTSMNALVQHSSRLKQKRLTSVKDDMLENKDAVLFVYSLKVALY